MPDSPAHMAKNLGLHTFQVVLEPILERLQRLESMESLIQQWYKQYDDGSFYITFNADGLGLSDVYIADFQVPAGTSKVQARGYRVFDAGNPGQILGGRYAASGFPNGGGYIPDNQSSGANENQFHIQGWTTVYTPIFDPVYGVGPGIFEGTIARIAFYTDAIPVIGSAPGSIVFQTSPSGTPGWNVGETTYMSSSADWQVGDHTRFGGAGIYSDGNSHPGPGRLNVFAGGPAHAEAIGFTLAHALKAVDTFGGAKISQQFMFKDETGQNQDAVTLQAFKIDDYYGGTSQHSSGFSIALRIGGNGIEYMRFANSITDRKLRIAGSPIGSGGGIQLDPTVIQAYGAAYRYLIMDPTTGDLAISAIGPAS